jgi:hypothetical protein
MLKLGYLPGTRAHACNLSYSEGRDKKFMILGQPGKVRVPYYNKQARYGACHQKRKKKNCSIILGS